MSKENSVKLSNIGAVDRKIVQRYEQYLCLERSYTQNTLDAYKKDLQKLPTREYLQPQQ